MKLALHVYCYNIGRTSNLLTARNPCFVDLILAVSALCHYFKTLVYTWVKSFCRFDIKDSYQTAKLICCRVLLITKTVVIKELRSNYIYKLALPYLNPEVIQP